ncbi:MAG TPA: methyltransferase domain-containing protein [Gemmatimonadaceae bacterium]|nr:methyltransferase domain-containing protein [Gemmatimonadaceae bacterium]
MGAAPDVIRRAVTLPNDLPLHEYHLRLGAHEWTIAHSGAILSAEDEQRYLSEERSRAPYGIALWPAAIALAHELASRPSDLAGLRVLEIGAGTGLPGIVAATYGARVVQTDRLDAALALGRLNAERNGMRSIVHHLADWTEWTDTERYDFILGSDVIYPSRLHPSLRSIFETNLAPTGRVLLSDPFRWTSLALLEGMEEDGWTVTVTKWRLEGEWGERLVAGYELRQGTAAQTA